LTGETGEFTLRRHSEFLRVKKFKEANIKPKLFWAVMPFSLVEKL
jgi:hypothetical protein